MDATYVAVTVRNLGQPDRAWEGEFLVDASVHHSRVPRRHLVAIGIEPQETRLFERADGTSATLEVGAARLDFMGEYAPTNVIFGADDSDPVLGRIALTAAALRFDPVSKRLERTKRFLYSRRRVG